MSVCLLLRLSDFNQALAYVRNTASLTITSHGLAWDNEEAPYVFERADSEVIGQNGQVLFIGK